MKRFTHSAPQDFAANQAFKTFCDVKHVARLLGSGLFGDFVMHPHGIRTSASHYSHDGFHAKFHHEHGFGLTEHVSWTNARIRHYVVKSLAEHRDIKAARGCADMKSQYDAAHFRAFDRNDVYAPLDADALALLNDTMHDIEDQLSSTRSDMNGRRLRNTLRVSWDARPPLRLLLRKLR